MQLSIPKLLQDQRKIETKISQLFQINKGVNGSNVSNYGKKQNEMQRINSAMTLSKAIGNQYSRLNRNRIQIQKLYTNNSNTTLVSNSSINSSVSLIQKGRLYGNTISMNNCNKQKYLEKQKLSQLRNFTQKKITTRPSSVVIQRNDIHTLTLSQHSRKPQNTPEHSQTQIETRDLNWLHYENCRNRFILYEENTDLMVKMYGESGFLREYIDMLKFCQVYEKTHKHVTPISSFRIEKFINSSPSDPLLQKLRKAISQNFRKNSKEDISCENLVESIQYDKLTESDADLIAKLSSKNSVPKGVNSPSTLNDQTNLANTDTMSNSIGYIIKFF